MHGQGVKPNRSFDVCNPNWLSNQWYKKQEPLFQCTHMCSEISARKTFNLACCCVINEHRLRLTDSTLSCFLAESQQEPKRSVVILGRAPPSPESLSNSHCQNACTLCGTPDKWTVITCQDGLVIIAHNSGRGGLIMPWKQHRPIT